MGDYDSSGLREALLDPETFGELSRYFVAKSCAMHAAEAGDSRFGEYLDAGLTMLLEENLALVFDKSESPIETIFVNSLLLAFIKADPLNLVVQHPVGDAPTQMDAFRQTRAKFTKFLTWYRESHGGLDGIEDYLDDQLKLERMDASEHAYLRRHLVYYEYLSLENRFHLILQPGMPDIVERGRTIRPDMLLWIPSDESVKVIVECDGFQHHKEKRSFIQDRKRDRALVRAGYTVLRYSGSEIYADPVGTSVDLAEHLWAIQEAASDA